MAGESERFWDTWGGYVKFGGAVLGAAAAGVATWHAQESAPEPSATSPAVYDLRVQEATQDIKVLETEARALEQRVRANSEGIAKLRAEMEALHSLAEERERRFLAVETEGRRLAERQEDILDRLRRVEGGRAR